MRKRDEDVGFIRSDFEGRVTVKEIINQTLDKLGAGEVVPGEPSAGATVELIRTPIGVGNATVVTAEEPGTAAAQAHSHRFLGLVGTVNGMQGENLQEILEDINARLIRLERLLLAGV